MAIIGACVAFVAAIEDPAHAGAISDNTFVKVGAVLALANPLCGYPKDKATAYGRLAFEAAVKQTGAEREVIGDAMKVRITEIMDYLVQQPDDVAEKFCENVLNGNW